MLAAHLAAAVLLLLWSVSLIKTGGAPLAAPRAYDSLTRSPCTEYWFSHRKTAKLIDEQNHLALTPLLAGRTKRVDSKGMNTPDTMRSSTKAGQTGHNTLGRKT